MSELNHVAAMDAEVDRLGEALKEEQAHSAALAFELGSWGNCWKSPNARKECGNHDGNGCMGGEMGRDCWLTWARNRRGVQ